MDLQAELVRAISLEHDASSQLPARPPAKGGAHQGVDDAIMEQALIYEEMKKAESR